MWLTSAMCQTQERNQRSPQTEQVDNRQSDVLDIAIAQRRYQLEISIRSSVGRIYNDMWASVYKENATYIVLTALKNVRGNEARSYQQCRTRTKLSSI